MEKRKNNLIPNLYIVVPCYNEEKVLPVTMPYFRDKIDELIKLKKVSQDSKVLFVNDGSDDKTWEIIKETSEKEKNFLGISLSRNRGHQNALLAGLMEVKDRCDITISIDCDGQDDINAMNQMIDEYMNGAEIVYGVRNKRITDTWFKRITAEKYYKVLRWFGAEVIYNHADYRLVSTRVLHEFADFHEVNIYLRGMFPLVGFKSTSVYYERKERVAGESHYPLRKMLALAFDGITSLSVKPLHIITSMGLGMSIISFIAILYVFLSYVTGDVVPGWSSSVLCICLIGGIQLICLGVIGEYVGKIYMETKHRPKYIVEEKTGEISVDD